MVLFCCFHWQYILLIGIPMCFVYGLCLYEMPITLKTQFYDKQFYIINNTHLFTVQLWTKQFSLFRSCSRKFLEPISTKQWEWIELTTNNLPHSFQDTLQFLSQGLVLVLWRIQLVLVYCGFRLSVQPLSWRI